MEGVEMDDRVMQDGCRGILTVGDDTSAGFGSLPVPMFHEPVTESFLVPVDCVSDGDEGGWR